MISAFIFALGVLAGILIGIGISRWRTIGYLRIDHSDPSDPPLLFLELSKEVEYIAKQKTVSFKVKVEDFLPHE